MRWNDIFIIKHLSFHVEVWEWIMNSILHFAMNVINSPCWTLNYAMLANGQHWILNMLRCHMAKWCPGVLTHWLLGDFTQILVNFEPILVIDGWSKSCEVALRWMSRNLMGDHEPTLVPSDNRLFPDVIFTQFCVAKWRHQNTNDLRDTHVRRAI